MRNKDILSKLKDILEFLEQYFKIDRSEESKKILSNLGNVRVMVLKDIPGFKYKKGTTQENWQKLIDTFNDNNTYLISCMIEKKFNLDIDWKSYDADDPYVLSGYEVFYYWERKELKRINKDELEEILKKDREEFDKKIAEIDKKYA